LILSRPTFEPWPAHRLTLTHDKFNMASLVNYNSCNFLKYWNFGNDSQTSGTFQNASLLSWVLQLYVQRKKKKKKTISTRLISFTSIRYFYINHIISSLWRTGIYHIISSLWRTGIYHIITSLWRTEIYHISLRCGERSIYHVISSLWRTGIYHIISSLWRTEIYTTFLFVVVNGAYLKLLWARTS
jgi:hypothetical protein